MSAIEILIAKSLAQSIALEQWPSFGLIACSLEYVPELQGTDLSSIHISVVPGSLEIQVDTRDADRHVAEVHVVLAKHFSTPAELESLISLRGDIQDAIRSSTLPASTPPMPSNATWWSMEVEQTFDRDALSTKRLFLASLAVTYQLLVDKVSN